MNRFAGYVIAASKQLKGSHLRELRDQLEFLGDDNALANSDAITNLMTMSSRRRYVNFGASTGLESILPGVTTRVLGPPTLEQSHANRKKSAKDQDQYWT